MPVVLTGSFIIKRNTKYNPGLTDHHDERGFGHFESSGVLAFLRMNFLLKDKALYGSAPFNTNLYVHRRRLGKMLDAAVML